MLLLRGAGALGDHIQRLFQFLVGDDTGGIKDRSTLKFRDCSLQVALVAELQALVNVQLAGFKARLVQLNPVQRIVGLSLKCFQVIVDGGVEIVHFRGFFAGVIVLVALLGAASGENRDHNPDEYVTPAAHEDSGYQNDAKLRLSYPWKSSIGLTKPASRGLPIHQPVSLSEL